MSETRTPAEATSARRVKQHRRIKRGIVASYIHELSERHNDNVAGKGAAVIAAPREKAA
jgi:hypothetical protein